MSTIAIVGSRGFPDPEKLIVHILDSFPADELVSGGAPGVDRLSELEGKNRGMKVISYRPKRAGSEYIIQMFEDERLVDALVSYPDFPTAAKARNWIVAAEARGNLHALWDGYSGGTAHAIAASVCRYPQRPPKIWTPKDSLDAIPV